MRPSFLKEYLSFTKKERTGITVLLVLIILFLLLPLLFPFFIHHQADDDSKYREEIAALKFKKADSAGGYSKRYSNTAEERDEPGYSYHNNYNSRREAPSGELFPFDPNTLSPEGWQRLGLREKTINTIQHYLASGGRFRQADDIRKIWGLHDDEIARLLPYVKIEDQPSSKTGNTGFSENRITYSKKEKSYTAFDINTADTSAFIALPGIGSKLAARIIAFRDKLGGFYSTAQVAETYGLPDSTFQKIKSYLLVNNPPLKMIHLNTATADELKQHPYIRYNLAATIVQYRHQHGKFLAIADLKKIVAVDEALYAKLAPYLSVE